MSFAKMRKKQKIKIKEKRHWKNFRGRKRKKKV